MKKNVQRTLLILFFINLMPQISTAQISAIPFTAALDTFSPITGTTVDTQWADDVTYKGIPIGFTFNYGGVSHDYMSLNTNGYIELDSTGTNAFYTISFRPEKQHRCSFWR